MPRRIEKPSLLTPRLKSPGVRSSPPIFAVPRGRPRWDEPFEWARLLLIGPIERDCRRILMEPWSRDGIDLQSIEGNRAKHAVEIGDKQSIEDLPQSVIMERGACEVGLEQG
jgi:hypothetical protein